jgi:hypothetical protein
MSMTDFPGGQGKKFVVTGGGSDTPAGADARSFLTESFEGQ